MTTQVLSRSFQFRWLTSLLRQCQVVNYLPSLILAGTAELCLPRSGTDHPRFLFTSNKQPLFLLPPVPLESPAPAPP